MPSSRPHPVSSPASPRAGSAVGLRPGSAAREVARAEDDYQRLRAAYLEVARHERHHEVALAMLGADMDRAHARLQALLGLPRLPFTREPSEVVRREAERMSAEDA